MKVSNNIFIRILHNKVNNILYLWLICVVYSNFHNILYTTVYLLDIYSSEELSNNTFWIHKFLDDVSHNNLQNLLYMCENENNHSRLFTNNIVFIFSRSCTRIPLPFPTPLPQLPPFSPKGRREDSHPAPAEGAAVEGTAGALQALPGGGHQQGEKEEYLPAC